MHQRVQPLDRSQIKIAEDGLANIGSAEVGSAEVGSAEVGMALQLHFLGGR